MFKKSIILVFIILPLFVIGATATEPVTGYQPKIYNICYFPAMPDEFASSTYQMILKDSNNDYFMILDSNPIYYLNHTYDKYKDIVCTGYGNGISTLKVYKYDSSVLPPRWVYVGIRNRINMPTDNKIVYYTNSNIKDLISGGIYFKKYDDDFMMTSIKLGEIQDDLSDYAYILVPVAVGGCSAFIVVKMIRSFLHVKVRKKPKQKIKKWQHKNMHHLSFFK